MPGFGNAIGIPFIRRKLSGLRAKFRGDGTITAMLDPILRDLSADFVSQATVTAALETIKLLDADFSGEGTVTGELLDFTGLLDEYPNAAAAYSVRLLRSDYTGGLVEIRRSSDNSTKSFLPDSNNELSLSSEAVVGSQTLGNFVGANDGFVVTWYDQSGNSNDASNSTASEQPKIISSGSLITDNGKAAIEYTSSTQKLNLSLDFTQTHSVFTVNNFSTTGREIIGATQRYLIFRDATDTFYRLTNNGFTTFGGVITLNQQLLYIDKKSTTVSLYENGSQIGTTQSSSGTSVVVDSLSGESTQFNFLGTMHEIIVYTSDQSSNKTEIETNINDFFSIY